MGHLASSNSEILKVKNIPHCNVRHSSKISQYFLLVQNGLSGRKKVKTLGDGANISRISNYIVLSFALLSDEQDVMSTKDKDVLL